MSLDYRENTILGCKTERFLGPALDTSDFYEKLTKYVEFKLHRISFRFVSSFLEQEQEVVPKRLH